MGEDKIQTYRDLTVWKRAMDLVTVIYADTQSFPETEKYGLTSQIRRSAVSIPSNIAEGYGRNSTNDYIRFLQIGLSSLYELRTQLEISVNLKYLSKKSFEILNAKCLIIEKMLNSLIKKLRQYL